MEISNKSVIARDVRSFWANGTFSAFESTFSSHRGSFSTPSGPPNKGFFLPYGQAACTPVRFGALAKLLLWRALSSDRSESGDEHSVVSLLKATCYKDAPDHCDSEDNLKPWPYVEGVKLVEACKKSRDLSEFLEDRCFNRSGANTAIAWEAIVNQQHPLEGREGESLDQRPMKTFLIIMSLV